jgi:hypothetical protein
MSRTVGAPEREAGAGWATLFEAMLDCHVDVAIRAREEMQAQLPAYGSIPADELDPGVRGQLQHILLSARAGQSAVSAAGVAELAAVGELRARQGVPVEEMLRGWRIGIQLVIARSREVASARALDDGVLLDFVESVLAWADVAMVTTAGAHRRAEIESARQDQERRASFVRGVLLGSLGQAAARTQHESYGVDPTQEYVAFRARPAEGGSLERLGALLETESAIGEARLMTLIDGDLAGMLRLAPTAAVDGIVGVGPPRPLDRLAESFRLATRALATADAFGLTGVYDVPALGLRAAVIADGDVGEALRSRYLAPLEEAGSAPELVASLRAYFECGMHIQRAATRLFVHQNTLRYRIARFEELTGANLRDPHVAFEVWWALERAQVGDLEETSG